ncbi:unnamed protein product [Rotaria socialis]|uniref:Uncharacterized protein n=1 Tax=Rotaria socialis TaxID=392032 RepID=A0A821VLN6_9BILA|nr:unnamed protein product [Rotaria socialis]CAF4910777.1 unnamed protein product [Rotaria socialis]
MNLKKFCACVCCGDRLTASCRRSLKGKCIRLFDAARLFPTSLPADGYICTKCRFMFNQWTALPEFCDALTTINNNHQAENSVTNVLSDENEDNGTDQLIDDTSSVADSMDDGSIRVQAANASSSDSESIYDSTATSDQVDDEEFNSDESSEAMDTIPSDENIDEQSIEVPIEVSVFSKIQCCVCKKQIVPPTVTICEADRTELFIRRHIEIPAGSRGCKLHTADKRLIPEAFQSLVPHKVQYRLFSRQTLINLLKSYRTRLNSNKHLDFDECMCLTNVDYIKLTGFTRAQHAHILSHIPPTSLKNSAAK